MISAARRVFALLERGERRQFAWILLGMLVTGLIATAGVASIMPFMSLVARPEVVHENVWLSRVYELLGFATPVDFLFAAGVLTLVLLVAGNALRAFTDWKILRFSRDMEYRLSRRLLARYLAQPYAFFVSRNTATLSQKILYEVGAVVTGVLMPGMRALAQAFTAFFILVLLLAVDVVLALSAALVLGAVYGLIYASVRQKQARLGKERVAANQQRFQIASEAFGGIKDVKVLGREGHFLQRFERPSQRFARTVADNAIIGELPRHALEAIAFGGILVVLLYYLSVGQPVDRALPILGLYAFAAYRLMPSLQQIFVAVNQARFSAAALDSVYEDLGNTAKGRGARHVPAEQGTSRRLPFTREVRLEDVCFQYPGAEEPALENVSLVLPRNRTVGLVGPTGSGKTTLVDLLLGLYMPTSGSIVVDDVRLDASLLSDWRALVGYVPQAIYLADDTVLHNIAFGVPDAELDRAAAERAARIAQLHDFVRTLPKGYDTVVGERGVRLSGGQRQRIGIARALYHDPDVLVMDEATSALDTLTEGAVMDAITELAGQKTMILIAHRLSTVRSCDNIYLLDGGRVIATGDYESLRGSHSMFQAMTGGTRAASA